MGMSQSHHRNIKNRTSFHSINNSKVSLPRPKHLKLNIRRRRNSAPSMESSTNSGNTPLNSGDDMNSHMISDRPPARKIRMKDCSRNTTATFNLEYDDDLRDLHGLDDVTSTRPGDLLASPPMTTSSKNTDNCISVGGEALTDAIDDGRRSVNQTNCTPDNMININEASEEQLMTVGGIDRRIAHNIVEYRGKIGGKFRIIEDLALVSGIGAHRLIKMKLELYCPISSSATFSMLTSCTAEQTSNCSGSYGKSIVDYSQDIFEPIDINTCNIFALIKVPGIKQSLAEKIVLQRNKKGAYRCVDDLKGVHGISNHLVDRLSPYFYVSDDIAKNCSNSPRKCTKFSKARYWLKSVASTSTMSSSSSNNCRRVSPPCSSATSGSLGNTASWSPSKCRLSRSISGVSGSWKVCGATPSGSGGGGGGGKRWGKMGPPFLSSTPRRNTYTTLQPLASQQYQLQQHRQEKEKSIFPRESTSLGANKHHRKAAGKTFQRSASNDGSCHSDISGIEGPLCHRSIRVEHCLKMTGVKKCCRLDKKIRIASWDLDHCTNEKIANPGVREVICMTLLENNFGIIAVQDIHNEAVLEKICSELNNPTIINVSAVGYKSLWQSVSSHCMANHNNEALGLIFDTSSNIHLMDTVLINECSTFMAIFKMAEIMIAVVNCSHLNEENRAATFTKVLDSINRDIAILIMDKDMNSQDASDVCGLTCHQGAKHLSDISPPGLQTKCSFWMNQRAMQYFNDTSEYVTTGLTNPWIPSGWSWGGLASGHAPLWAEFATVGSTPSSASAAPSSGQTVSRDFNADESTKLTTAAAPFANNYLARRSTTTNITTLTSTTGSSSSSSSASSSSYDHVKPTKLKFDDYSASNKKLSIELGSTTA